VMLTIPSVATNDHTIDIKLIRLPSSIRGGGPTLSMLEIYRGSCTPTPVDACEASVALPMPVAFAVPLADRSTKVAAVFSCQELGWEPLSASGSTMCRQSKIRGGCFLKKKSFAEASEMCRTEGARLCTAEELKFSQPLAWNVCNLRQSPVWSGTSCTLQSDPSMSAYIVASGPKKARKSYCKPVAKNNFDVMGSLQCCADVSASESNSLPPAQAEALSESTCADLDWDIKFVHSEQSIVLKDGAVAPLAAAGTPSRSVCGQAQLPGLECRKDDARFEEAGKLCESAGGRLCTSAELRGGATKGTGCKMGRKQWVWSQTACTEPGVATPSFLVERAFQSSNEAAGLCWPSVGANAKASMQCCADELDVSSSMTIEEAVANQILADVDADTSSSFPFEVPLAVCGAAVAILIGVVAALVTKRNRADRGEHYTSQQPSTKPGSHAVVSTVADLDWDDNVISPASPTVNNPAPSQQAAPRMSTFYEAFPPLPTSDGGVDAAASSKNDAVGTDLADGNQGSDPVVIDADANHQYYLAGQPVKSGFVHQV